jgi:hypothetical protein
VTDQRSGPLAAWTSLWIAGQVSLDEVIDAVTGDDGPHLVVGLTDLDDDLDALRGVLLRWRRGGHGVRLVLPVAGDVRGLPGPTGFRSAALEMGETVVGAGLALVPEYVDYYPSSAPPTVIWHAYEVDDAPPDPQLLTDAQYDLTTAIRDTATALRTADVAGWAAEIGDALSDARRASERLNLPRSFPSRAVAVLSQAERLQAVLDLADQDPVGGAYDRAGIAARAAALRPLATAVRRARLAGYNAAADLQQA